MEPLALFDLDNTLLDREQAFGRWVERFVASHGLDRAALPVIARADADGFAPREEFFTGLRRELAIDDPVDDLLEEYRVQYPSHFTVEPETVHAVRALRASGVKVGIVTNGPPSQWAKLESTRTVDEFDAVCISAVVGSWKPDLGIFREAARACGVPLEGWMVGDSAEADIVGGATAGLRTIWMARGREWNRSDLVPDHVVDSIPQAVDVILATR